MGIHGPIEGHKHSGVKDIESYRVIHMNAMKNAEKDTHEIDVPQDAYINHGRWVVDCQCNGAGLTSPSFKVSCCFDCGRVYTNITFPKQVKKIEEALVARYNQSSRNWKGESLQVLLNENLEHEVT
jgi:hypothetical protein